MIALGAAAACAACNDEPAPKPVAAKPPPTAAAAPVPAAPPSVQHTIGEGETLWDIAKSYGVTMKDLMAANHFDSEDIRRLRKGAQIKVPGVDALVDVQTRSDRAAEREALPPLTDGAYHFLHRGESLWTIARLYDVTVEAIMARNGFSEDVHGQLRVGQPIVIPGI